MNNPKKYLSYDLQTNNCEHCKSALLYQLCSICKDEFACAGWADENGVYSCQCFEAESNRLTGDIHC
jgi:hypothetical protein